MTDICQFFQVVVLEVLISWCCDVDYDAGLFLIVDQHDVRLIVKQMLVGLDEEGPEDLDMIVFDYSDTPLCQAPCRGFSYQAAASSGSFQVAMRHLPSAISRPLSAFLLK